MFRIVEVLGIVAPVAGIIVLVIYRWRAKTGVVWGVIGAAVAIGASIVGVMGPRLSLLGGGARSGDLLIENMHSWAMTRVVLLLISVILLAIAFSGRNGARTPIGWLAVGIPLVTVGFALSFARINFGAGNEGASEIVSLLVEAVQFALIGIGVLMLCLAVVSGRSSADGRREPAQMMIDAAARSKQFYDRAHAYRR